MTTVALLGFFGSTEQNLQRPAALWQTLQPNATLILNPSPDLAPSFSSIVALEQQILNSAPSRLVLHVFSNRGTFMYLALVLRGRLTISGVVFDSAPGDLTLISLVRAMAANSAKQPLTRAGLLISPVIALVLLARRWGLFGLLLTYALAQLPSSLVSQLYLSLVSRLNPVPSLFIFSAQDALVLRSAVVSVLAARQARFKDQFGCEMHGSAHVRHLIDFPSQYSQALGELLARI